MHGRPLSRPRVSGRPSPRTPRSSTVGRAWSHTRRRPATPRTPCRRARRRRTTRCPTDRLRSPWSTASFLLSCCSRPGGRTCWACANRRARRLRTCSTCARGCRVLARGGERGTAGRVATGGRRRGRHRGSRCIGRWRPLAGSIPSGTVARDRPDRRGPFGPGAGAEAEASAGRPSGCTKPSAFDPPTARTCAGEPCRP